jgi:hypothetical protein
VLLLGSCPGVPLATGMHGRAIAASLSCTLRCQTSTRLRTLPTPANPSLLVPAADPAYSRKVAISAGRYSVQLAALDGATLAQLAGGADLARVVRAVNPRAIKRVGCWLLLHHDALRVLETSCECLRYTSSA